VIFKKHVSFDLEVLDCYEIDFFFLCFSFDDFDSDLTLACSAVLVNLICYTLELVLLCMCCFEFEANSVIYVYSNGVQLLVYI
jgi:hypothetical protein